MYFSHGEFIELYTSRLVDCDEIKEIISRLEVVTSGCKVIDLCCLYFITARRYASAVLAVVVCLSVCPSVRLSVCLSQAGIVSKRQHIESRKQRRTVAQGI